MIGFMIGGKHTFEDWGLKCKGYKITLPERQKNLFQVPGRNGKIDMSLPEQREAYKHRKIEIYCDAPDRNYEEWVNLVSDIANYVQDEYLSITPDFDKDWYYRGWVTISPSKNWKEGSDIVFVIDAEPYKLKQDVTVITIVGNDAGVTAVLSNAKKKVTPKLTTDQEITIDIGDSHLAYAAGTYSDAGFTLSAGETEIVVTGEANVTIEYQEAKL